MGNSSPWILGFGLLLVVVAWFSFTLYYFTMGIMNQIVYFTDVPASVGLGFRTAAGLIALVTSIFYLARKMSPHEVLAALRWVVFLEGVYWLTLLPSAIWGFQCSGFNFPREVLIISTGVPCLVESTVTPTSLFLLFAKLNPENPIEIKVKWGLVAGTIYIFVFWFNYSMQWFAEAIRSNPNFIISHIVNAFAFAITVFGLLSLAFYSFFHTRRYWKRKQLTIKPVGLIITFFGFYFNIILVFWHLFGSPTGWNIWHTFFIYHNVDLWLLFLPAVGLPLFLTHKD